MGAATVTVQPCSMPAERQCSCPTLRDVCGPCPVAGQCPSWERAPGTWVPARAGELRVPQGWCCPLRCLRLGWQRGHGAHLPSDVLLAEMGSSSPALSEPFLVLQDVLRGSTCGEPVELGPATAAYD